jgi:hypothetical protein
MADLFQVNIGKKEGLPPLSWHLDHAALETLTAQKLGRTLLVTDRRDRTAGEVVSAYRSLSRIEETFKSMKNTDFLSWQPAWHWTDQKLQVHAFYWVLALLLSTLAHKLVREAGMVSLFRSCSRSCQPSARSPLSIPEVPTERIS